MKIPTTWITQPGYDTAGAGNVGYDLLIETEFHLLLETGFRLLLEDATVIPRETTIWNNL